jgi:heme/copper-type cytochrome/quinol oxidase subunit 2
MNILDLLFEPYVIIILLSILITIIAYFVIDNDNKSKDDDDEKTEVGKSLLYTFIGSIITLTLLKFGFSYMNTKNYFQKGGDLNDRLTIVADDVDIGILE